MLFADTKGFAAICRGKGYAVICRGIGISVICSGIGFAATVLIGYCDYYE